MRGVGYSSAYRRLRHGRISWEYLTEPLDELETQEMGQICKHSRAKKQIEAVKVCYSKNCAWQLNVGSFSP
jgi:hypothetical protein